MLTKFSHFLTIATITTLTCVIAHPSAANPSNSSNASMAEEVLEPNIPLSVSELINQAFSQYSGSFFQQASLEGQLNTIFGWNNSPQGSFPENNITRDGLLLNVILADYYKQLQQHNPTFKTKDLNSPFDSSISDNVDYLR